MKEDLKIRELLETSIGDPPPSPRGEAEKILGKIEAEKVVRFTPNRTPAWIAWPLALAASLAMVFLFWPKSTPVQDASNGQLAEFVYESYASPYEEPNDSELYAPWVQLAEAVSTTN